MWQDNDPSLPQIRRAFLDFVEQFHQTHNFIRDFTQLAQLLGIKIKPAKINKAFYTPNGESVILVDFDVSPNRVAFTGLHELCHHLFWLAHEGELKAHLDDYFYKRPDASRQFEEWLCYEAAALLLMPSAIAREILEHHGYVPLAVFTLSNATGASHQAAMRRVIQLHSLAVHAVLLTSAGYVLDSVAYGSKREKYTVGKDFQIESGHLLIAGSYTAGKSEVFKAPIPFKGGKRSWHSQVVSGQDDKTGRILAFFFDEQLVKTPRSRPLFDMAT